MRHGVLDDDSSRTGPGNLRGQPQENRCLSVRRPQHLTGTGGESPGDGPSRSLLGIAQIESHPPGSDGGDQCRDKRKNVERRSGDRGREKGRRPLHRFGERFRIRGSDQRGRPIDRSSRGESPAGSLRPGPRPGKSGRDPGPAPDGDPDQDCLRRTDRPHRIQGEPQDRGQRHPAGPQKQGREYLFRRGSFRRHQGRL